MSFISPAKIKIGDFQKALMLLTGVEKIDPDYALPSTSTPYDELKQVASQLVGKGKDTFIYLDEAETHGLGLCGLAYDRKTNSLLPRAGFSFPISPEQIPPFLAADLGNALDDGQQRINKVIYDRYERRRINNLPVTEKPDAKRFRSIQLLMQKTASGDWADRFIYDSGLPILFAEREGGERTPTQAFYSTFWRRVRVYDEYRSKRELTEDVLHEVRHGWHHKTFPEMFLPKESIIDSYVVTKLIEMDANAIAFDHKWSLLMAETHTRDLAPHTLEDSSSEVCKRFVTNNVHARMIEELGLKLDYGHVFMTRTNHIGWYSYEDEYYVPEMIKILESGKFEEHVASSPFLQIDFLQRFCIAPNGDCYLPHDTEKFRQDLIKSVATLHHPVFAPHVERGQEATARLATKNPAATAWPEFLKVIK